MLKRLRKYERECFNLLSFKIKYFITMTCECWIIFENKRLKLVGIEERYIHFLYYLHHAIVHFATIKYVFMMPISPRDTSELIPFILSHN